MSLFDEPGMNSLKINRVDPRSGSALESRLVGSKCLGFRGNGRHNENMSFVSDSVSLSGRLKERTARGALVSSGAQALSFVLRTFSMIVLARLLIPKDFGLVGMVTSATGFIGLFRDAGLSLATVQRDHLTNEHVSTLFWINLGLGCSLATLSALMAPVLVTFYQEPRLFWITIALGSAFIFNGASAQHRAILQRSMRFLELALIDTISLVLSIAIAIAVAAAGYGCWALVVMTLGQAVLNLGGTWLTDCWIPGAPRAMPGLGSMLRFGGTVSFNSFLAYLAYNTDKILLGRFWGAEMLGIYGRAYQLAYLPTENLNTTLGLVAFPALSRLQNDPLRLRNYFLKGYRLFLSLTMPITITFALFADDIILVLLGPKWHQAAAIFRLLAPTVMVFGLINPFFWLILSIGHVQRSLRMALVLTPVIICGYTLGLSHGPHGVAAAFSITMLLLTAPFILWARRGTSISTRDIFQSAIAPLVSVAGGTLATTLAHRVFLKLQPDLLRLLINTTFFFVVYVIVLLFVMKQKTLFQAFVREIGLWPFLKSRRVPVLSV